MRNSKEEVIAKICDKLKMKCPLLTGDSTEECVKELCVARLCESIGIKCKYNFKSDFFRAFSTLVGQALCDSLNLNCQVANADVRLVKYNNINFVQEVKEFFEVEQPEEAIIDAFHFVDRHRYIIQYFNLLQDVT